LQGRSLALIHVTGAIKYSPAAEGVDSGAIAGQLPGQLQLHGNHKVHD
jgi:hypothetical protein